jgi:hypothetical protein
MTPSVRELGSEKRVPRQERSAESLATAGSQLESQVNDIQRSLLRPLRIHSQTSSPQRSEKCAYLDFPTPSSPKSETSCIEDCIETHAEFQPGEPNERGAVDDLDHIDEIEVKRSDSWAQYYHSLKAQQLLGC